MARQSRWRWAEWLLDLAADGPLALVGWFPLTVAGLLIIGAIIGQSWVPVQFAAVIVVARLLFAGLEKLARVSFSDPPPDRPDRRPPP